MAKHNGCLAIMRQAGNIIGTYMRGSTKYKTDQWQINTYSMKYNKNKCDKTQGKKRRRKEQAK